MLSAYFNFPVFSLQSTCYSNHYNHLAAALMIVINTHWPCSGDPETGGEIMWCNCTIMPHLLLDLFNDERPVCNNCGKIMTWHRLRTLHLDMEHQHRLWRRARERGPATSLWMKRRLYERNVVWRSSLLLSFQCPEDLSVVRGEMRGGNVAQGHLNDLRFDFSWPKY